MTAPVIRKCIVCRKKFNTTSGSTKCYECTLKALTGDLPPQEGDFNTARITSGTMSAQERRWLQEDLKSVEVQEDPYQEEYEEEQRRDDDRWDDDDKDCPDCGVPMQYCRCL